MAEEATSVPTLGGAGALQTPAHLSTHTPRQYSQRLLHHCYKLPPAQWLKAGLYSYRSGGRKSEGASSGQPERGLSPLLSPQLPGASCALLACGSLPPAPEPAL